MVLLIAGLPAGMQTSDLPIRAPQGCSETQEEGNRVLAQPFTINNGLLTPTLKTRRGVVADRYRARSDALYAKPAGG